MGIPRKKHPKLSASPLYLDGGLREIERILSHMNDSQMARLVEAISRDVDRRRRIDRDKRRKKEYMDAILKDVVSGIAMDKDDADDAEAIERVLKNLTGGFSV